MQHFTATSKISLLYGHMKQVWYELNYHYKFYIDLVLRTVLILLFLDNTFSVEAVDREDQRDDNSFRQQWGGKHDQDTFC